MDTFDRIDQLLKIKGISGAKMSRDLGFSTAVYSQWKHRIQKPSADKVTKMAEYFGVSVGYLMGVQDEATASDILSEIDIAFLGDYNKLTESDKNTLRDMASLMRSRKTMKK